LSTEPEGEFYTFGFEQPNGHVISLLKYGSLKAYMTMASVKITPTKILMSEQDYNDILAFSGGR
jgi:hypothetical protein